MNLDLHDKVRVQLLEQCRKDLQGVFHASRTIWSTRSPWLRTDRVFPNLSHLGHLLRGQGKWSIGPPIMSGSVTPRDAQVGSLLPFNAPETMHVRDARPKSGRHFLGQAPRAARCSMLSDSIGDNTSEEVDLGTVARTKVSGRFESVVGLGVAGVVARWQRC